MKRKWIVLLGCVTISIIVMLRFGSQRYVLENSSQFTLYSLQPQSDLFSGIHSNAVGFRRSKPQFQGHVVLGKTEIADAKTRTQLIEALYRGIEESRGVARCFNPRHAIRAKSGLRTVDAVICFECSQVMFCEFGQCLKTTPISNLPQSLFDRILKQANVPLGKRETH